MTDLVAELENVVGTTQVLASPDLRAGYERDWTGRFGGPSQLVVRPGSTAEVASVLRACAAAAVPVIPQGGNTGLVGGSVPDAARTTPLPVILSTARLNQLEPVDEAAAQVTAGAGVPLARLQQHAAACGLEFPVDLAARDTATVGGMIATNAGGLHVVRYGPMRAHVLGTEAVLADGSTFRRLDGLVKDNTGYDLSQLLVGSEGTLAVVTAARLRLVPSPRQYATALLGLEDLDAALRATAALRRTSEGLQAVEVFFAEGIDLVGLPEPLARRWPVYLLVECAGRADPTDTMIEGLAEADLAEDATALATDGPGRARLWAYRERHTEAVNALGVPHKLDVTLPADRLDTFERTVRTVVADEAPGSTLVMWGHVGDGNLHVNVVGPDPEDEGVDEAVYRLVARLGGSISAEHGIGRAKARWLPLTRSNAEIAAMTAIKTALDPAGSLNPGAIIGGTSTTEF
jgi:FAD/FMN-containing dehydrogenase